MNCSLSLLHILRHAYLNSLSWFGFLARNYITLVVHMMSLHSLLRLKSSETDSWKNVVFVFNLSFPVTVSAMHPFPQTTILIINEFNWRLVSTGQVPKHWTVPFLTPSPVNARAFQSLNPQFVATDFCQKFEVSSPNCNNSDDIMRGYFLQL